MKETNMEHYRDEIEVTEENEFCFGFADGKIFACNEGKCAVGDTVYEIPSKVNYELNILNKLEEQNRVYNQKIKEIIFTKRGWYVTCDKYEEYGIGSVLLGEEFGESWFLTKEEAEAKLKELKK